jgi:hypothetical protein
MTVFICRNCGQGHLALAPTKSAIDPKEQQILKEKWLFLYNKLSEKPDDLNLDQRMGKAMAAYFATITNGVEQVPETITTKKYKDQHYFVCAEKCK